MHIQGIARTRTALVIVPLVLFMVLAGCQSSAVRNLQLIVAGSEAVIAALETTGSIPAPIAVAINVYMGQVSEFVTFATAELASADSGAIKASKIAAEAASVSKVDLPPGTPTLLATSIQAVATALATFLGNIQTTAMNLQASGYESSFAEKGKPKKIKVSEKDKAELEKLHARALALKARFPKK